MPCCTKNSDCRWRWLTLCMLLLSASTAFAAAINIEKAEARLTSEGYVLSANFDIQLSPQVQEALRHSVTLNFVSELALHRSRWYWPDTELALHEQTSKLSFNSLTRQYRINRGGLFQSFATLEDALRVLGRVSTLPIKAEVLDNSGDGYFSRLAKKGSLIGATASMRLDVSQLPKPLQINALTSEQWNIESEQFHWEIRAEAAAVEQQP
ncbi:MAG: DUF4390 domain-containing protein [Gallionellales bacterium CG_4_9_14_0_8_um_filter_59_50]|nr:MAG: DUF4390 domain-containing protein [Gallionellales bacterium CG08_land_8_20_14_0_20_59_87]PJC02834.1 MAG: DUF4390 domain-containing protein [Gallionellales bacterium CG_4_9_14_0_8_um_filter_59_50]